MKEQELVAGGKANELEKQRFKEMQEKIEQQKMEHEILIQKKLEQEEEKLKMEKGFQSLSEEVGELRKLVKYLRKKYSEAVKEIKDLEQEFEKEKEDLLDTIRVQEKEVKLYNGIMKMLLSSDEMDKIKGACEWSENKNDFLIPPFVLKNKKVKFPALNSQQALDLINQEKDSREVFFSDQENGQSKKKEKSP